MRDVTRLALGTIAAVGFAFPALGQDDALPRATPIGNPASWIPANAYPPAAKASAEEGRVSFKLTIDETGSVSDCKVTTSSESPLLDETTCNLMSANGRFTPPRDKRNRPVVSQWSSSVRWKLEVAPVAPLTTTAPVVVPVGKAKNAYPRGNPATWFTAADYPAGKRAGQGEVRALVSIDASGKIIGCTVTKTSGFPILDRLTCDLVRRRATFFPASDAQGNAIASTYPIGTTWVGR